jgi:MarR family transcriptional regulator, lower aerobic nicotinate degradation pathway regulator
MRREKLNMATPAAAAAGHGRYVLDDQVGFLLRVALQLHTAIFTTRMIEGLTQTQFAALAKLHEVSPCSQNHLGRLIYLDTATIKGVVDRLGERGFLTALNDPMDRRRRALALTDRGRQVTQAAQLFAAEITAATLAAFSENEQRAVVNMLRKLA